MAELNLAPSDRGRKKRSTRVDLTPMVDLGFLLITFFVFTTSMTTPSTLKLHLPADGLPMPVAASTSITLIPLSDNRVFYYVGELDKADGSSAGAVTDYQIGSGISRVIRERQQALLQQGRSATELVLIIKMSDESNLQGLVDALDEIGLAGLTRYAMTDIDRVELEILKGKGIAL